MKPELMRPIRSGLLPPPGVRVAVTFSVASPHWP